MATIKAPFNFVPLSDKVFFPEWADEISQDIPFEDGISGTIELKIKAETPIFVRNGHTQNDAEEKNEAYKSFSKTEDKKYFIPGTTIKGELRNLIEIMSFGKMKVDSKRYAMRDLSLRDYRNRFVYENIHCGWMSFEPDEIRISDRGIPYRISHVEIDKHLEPQKNFCDLFGPDSKIKDENKSAQYKYGFVDPQKLSKTYKFRVFKIADASVDKRVGAKFADDGDKIGRIVFTGQPGPRKPGYKYFDKKAQKEVTKKSTGKFWEFVFPETEINSYTFDWYGEMMEDFKFIYKDSNDWAFWKKKLEKGEQIPVFLCVENGVVKSIGLSYLYKLPFNNRMDEMLPKDHRSERMDLAECIFGSIEGSNALRGRVQVSNALCTEARIASPITSYMASPKPTYYPIYLQQNGKNGYMDNAFSTLLDSNAHLKGRKMYPVRSNQSDFVVPIGQEKNASPALPLDKHSVFTCSIRYHNLKRVELGALISAIELSENCCHSLGAFKPYGYGACVYTVTSELEEKDTLKQEFIHLMEENIENYSKTEQMMEFWAMLNIRKSEYLKRPLEYMELDEFVDCKRSNPKKGKWAEYLPWYSELVENPKPILSTKTIEMAHAKVTVLSGPIKQAALIEGKGANQSKMLDVDKVKLKIGDLIEVKVIRKGGNIEKLVFVNKL